MIKEQSLRLAIASLTIISLNLKDFVPFTLSLCYKYQLTIIIDHFGLHTRERLFLFNMRT